MVFRMVRAVVIAVAIMVAPLGIASASAQTADAESAKALRELVAEVRALRTTIEQYAATQIQSQAVSDLIGVQQRRITDVTGRLDMTRRELDASALESRRMSSEISNSEEALRRITDAKMRAEMEAMLVRVHQDLDRRSDLEQVMRTRESELQNSLNLEEAKWNELIDRLNRWLAR